MAYGLGVDLGTTYTAAAVSDAQGTRAIPLGHGVAVPSVVFATEGGVLITGDAADGEAKKNPHRASRIHKRRLADPTPLRVGDAVRSPASLMAAQLKDAVAVATATQGCRPQSVVLTCPAVWGPYRREHFSEVPRLAGLADVRIITEPEAAAMHYSVERRLGAGETIGVYDLGGGTFDATVLRKTPRGMEILGSPEGIEQLGGIDFDDSLVAHVDHKLGGELGRLDPEDLTSARFLMEVRESCRVAKERLSTKTSTLVQVELPGGSHEVEITRAEFDKIIKPHLDLTTEALLRSIRSAGLRPDDLGSVLLVGGSSQIPIVTATVSAAFGKPVRVGMHPKLSVALGAAAVARTRQAPPRPMPAVPAVRAAPGPGRAPRPVPHVSTSARAFDWLGRRSTVIAVVIAVVLLGIGVASAVLTGDDSPAAPVAGEATPSTSASEGAEFLEHGRDVAPYHSMIGSDDDWTGTALSGRGTATHKALAVRSGDGAAKAGGRLVTWSGSGPGQFYLQRHQGNADARPYLESGTLTFDVLVTKAPAAPVSLALHCHYPCAAQVGITELLAQAPVGEPTTIRVPLSCFTLKGLDPERVDVPFLVSTTGAFEAEFARVRWELSGTTAGQPVTPCASLA
ncbi:Hsp70 family protein [Lentzea sp. NPDC059081]|uniref:Hsp70 family protein n=1 Tax=Lentzea sp. NPDC059081 TaxID=3346719 RepID=UPI0036C01D2A